MRHLEEMPESERHLEVEALARRLEESWTTKRQLREETAQAVNHRITEYIASITGQRVRTSSEVRSFTVAQLLFPFAQGVCDVLSGDVALFRDTGIFEPHVICHEFVHRQGLIPRRYAVEELLA